MHDKHYGGAMRGISIGSNWIRYRHSRADSSGEHGTAAGPSGRPQLIAERSHLIASHHRRLLQTELPLHLALSFRRIQFESPLSPSHSDLFGSVFRPHRDSTSGPTYHWRSINISDRLAPTSQECDTARNSFELHISLGPAK